MSPAAASSTPASPAKGDTFSVTATPRPGSRMALEVAIPGERCQASYETAVEKLSRSIKLPGFRKGKVPRAVLLQQIGPLRVRATALEDLVDAAYRDALALEELAPLSRPELNEAFEAVLERFQPGEALSFTLELDVEPTPKLTSTRGLKAEAETITYDPARVDELIEQSRKQLATLVPVEGRSAESGDVAVLSFSGLFVDSGEAITGGSSEATEVELEEGRMIPGFVEGVIGMAVGDSRTVECQFPDSYPQEEAAGRQARFEIGLKDLKTRELPALDDAFAQQASDKQTLAELRADLEQRLRDDAESRARAARHEALLGALVEKLEVELPESLVQQEIRNLIEQTAGQIAQQGMDVKKLFTPELVRSLVESSRPEAEQRLRRNLALQALASAEGITLEDAELDAKVKEVRQGLENQSSIDPERLRQVVGDDLLREKLLDWLESHSTITEAAPAKEAAQEDSAAPGDTAAAEEPAAAEETTAAEEPEAADGEAARAATKG